MGYTNPQSECELSLFSDQTTCSIEKIQNWIQYVIAALNVSPTCPRLPMNVSCDNRISHA